MEHESLRERMVRTGYERFRIETYPAPPRRKQPRPFNPEVDKVRLAKWLVGEIFEYGLKLRHREYRKALLSRPCIYGTFGGRVGGFHPIRDKCVGCMRCVEEQPEMCRVSRNLDFFDFADSYWIPRDPATAVSSPVATVSYEASTGKIPIKGMGYRESFADEGWDSMWTDMSEIVRPTRDGVYGREYISTVVDVGRKPRLLEFRDQQAIQGSKTIQISVPLIFDYLPENLNGTSIAGSVAAAARRLGILHIASAEQVSDVDRNLRKRIVPIISASDVSEYAQMIADAPAVELTEYDSRVVERVRELNQKAPISVRLPLNENAGTSAAKMARDGVDVIHGFADYHGRAWEPHNPRFVKDLIRSVHGALVKESLRDQVTLIASGGITLAEHVPKAIACGADLVALDTTILVALQARFEGELASPADGRIRPEHLDEKWGEQRLVNLVGAWHDQLIEILSAMGMRDVRRLRGDVGRAMFKEDLEKEAFSDIIQRA
ncbi:MAG TPA: glutamate synthase-related protein [Candidatus Acidoferrum sp.]|nr:glutamate synthase-related protein [Candidatus Acidoferrum sp.]